MAKYELISPLLNGATFSNYTTANLTSGPISNEFATVAFRMGHYLSCPGCVPACRFVWNSYGFQHDQLFQQCSRRLY